MSTVRALLNNAPEPHLLPGALTRYDRAMLFGAGPEGGGLGFQKGAAPVDLEGDFRTTVHKPRDPNYGRLKKVAQAFVDGAYGPNADYNVIAGVEKVNATSLKNSIWRLRNQWKGKPRKQQRRRVAA